MAKWIFLEDFGLKHDIEQAINLDSVTNFSLRLDDAQLVIFFGGAKADPHVLTFQNKQLCQTAYDNLKAMLRTEK